MHTENCRIYLLHKYLSVHSAILFSNSFRIKNNTIIVTVLINLKYHRNLILHEWYWSVNFNMFLIENHDLILFYRWSWFKYLHRFLIQIYDYIIHISVILPTFSFARSNFTLVKKNISVQKKNILEICALRKD